jgi:hypothetical protein
MMRRPLVFQSGVWFEGESFMVMGYRLMGAILRPVFSDGAKPRHHTS